MPDVPNLRIKMLEKNIPSVLLLIFFSMEIIFVSVAHTKYNYALDILKLLDYVGGIFNTY